MKAVVLGLAAVAAFCAVPAAIAMPPSPALLERAARDDALAAHLAQFSRRAEARGIDAPAKERRAFTTDTVGPVCSGHDVSGLRGRPLQLRYRLTDGRSPLIRDVRVVILRRSGIVARTVRMGAATAIRSGRWYTTT